MSDPTDEPLLTDNDRRQLAAIAAERHPIARAALLRTYYASVDRLARTPRHYVAQHLDLLAGLVGGLGQALIDPATDAGLTDDDRRQLAAIHAEGDPIVAVGRIRAYWRDADRAARTSRATLYLHTGRLQSVIDHLLAAQLALDADAVARLGDERAALEAALPIPPVLCLARSGGPYSCTRAWGHDGDHVAGIGPWRPGLRALARWA